MDGLKRLHVRAAMLTSDQSVEDAARTLAQLRASPPAFKLLYLTPERLLQSAAVTSLLTSLHELRQVPTRTNPRAAHGRRQLAPVWQGAASHVQHRPRALVSGAE